MKGALLIDMADGCIMKNYARFPVVMVEGKGTKLWDADGKEYLDFVAGIAVCNLGHSHPKLVRAICEQAGRLMHVSNLYHIEAQIQLAAKLSEESFADSFFFCNSGAEANEAAIKLARRWGKEEHGLDCYEIITMEQSFHGRTIATISATGQEKVKKGFEPLPSGFSHVPFNDLAALSGAITPQTCAVMVEPIQGEGGVILPAPEYLREVKQLCEERKVLLIYDEVQVGMGRTGTLFAYEDFAAPPDIMTLAKSLAGGVPMGALCVTREIADKLGPGSHASTFGGNPLAASAALATLNIIEEENLLENCRRMGEYLQKNLQELQRNHQAIKEIRGKGLMWGMLIDRPGAPVVKEMMARGVLINCIQDKVLRVLPPLIINKDDIDQMIETLDKVLKEECQ